uniref:receptor-like protein EIX2 n=1 Tax=Erigeron canadensis TaxID=72917 RepID=UPI001CB9A3E9|nr:receptor-like protein EIX2 [Erigeron canadensis]
MERERQALLEFKHGLIDKTGCLGSWAGEDRKCCRWVGIVCDNITRHVHGIHLQSSFPYGECDQTRQLGGKVISSSLLLSGFSEIIPPQLGNLSQLYVLSVKSFDARMMNMRWLSSLCLLRHLDMSGVDLRKASDWFQVINTLPSLTELHLSACSLIDIHPHVPGLNITSLALLDLSYNNFSSFMPPWIFSTTNLVCLDISWCKFHSLIHGNIHSFRNLTSLKSLHVSGNVFMNSSLVFKGFLECKSHIGFSLPLEELDLTNSNISGTIPDFIGQLTSIRRLLLDRNKISGPIPHWIGRLSSLEHLELSDNRLVGSLPDGIGYLLKLEQLIFSNNFLTGIVSEAHFGRLASLKYLDGKGNNLTLQPRLANWIPPFQLRYLDLSSWSLGPNFPLWLHSQTRLTDMYIRNTCISSVLPVSFWKSFPNLKNLDMSHNHIQGTLLDIPATLEVLDLNSNQLRGELPELSSGSYLGILDLSSNFFVGSVHHLLCSYSPKKYATFSISALNLGNNRLSGVKSDCWDKWHELIYLNLENNRFSSEIPGILGSLRKLRSLNLRGNKLTGRIPASLMNLEHLHILQIGRNELVGSIPKWFGILSSLRLLNLKSNNFVGNIPHELCYATDIQILDLAQNHLSGNIPRCFNNFSVLSGKQFYFSKHKDIFLFGIDNIDVSGSDSLVMKGREDTYNTILGLVMLVDLSSNNLVGPIPSELTALRELKSLNLSRNQLTGMIPEKIGDMKSLETLDLSMNKLSGKLPLSLSSLTFLVSFNVSWNQLTGRIPSSTQLQSFNESSFFGNKLCGDPLVGRCLPTEVPNVEVRKEDDVSHGAADWGLITSVVVGIVVGFWVIVAPLMVSRTWRIAYFHFLSELRYMVYDIFRKYVWRQHVI